MHQKSKEKTQMGREILFLVLLTAVFNLEARKRCPQLYIENGNVQVRRRVVYAISCNQGYRLLGPDRLICRRNGIYNKRIPFCRPKQIIPSNECPKLKPPSNGSVYGGTSIGSRVRYICKTGYTLSGSQYRTCSSSKAWTGREPLCQKKGLLSVARLLKSNFIDKYGYFTNTSKIKNNSSASGRLIVGAKGLDLIFLLDRSSSIDKEDFKRGINFTKYITEEFGISNTTGGTRVAVVTFGTEAKLEFNLNDVTTIPDAVSRLNSIKASGGGTAMRKGFEIISLQIVPKLRPSAKRAIFMISDGKSNSGGPPEALAKAIRRDHDFEIFSIGIGNDLDKQQLKLVSSQPFSSHVFILDDFPELQRLISIISEKTVDYTQCGQSGDIESNVRGQARSIGSSDANQGAWPWVAAIYNTHDRYGARFECGGALICDQWVMTAAHCLDKIINSTHSRKRKRNEIDSVWLGEFNRTEEEGTEQRRTVVRVIQHKKYKFGRHAYDIGLLKLHPPIKLNKYARTICLPQKNDLISTAVRRNKFEGYVAGWGTTFKQQQVEPGQEDNSYLPSFVMKQVQLPVTNRRNCEETLGYSGESLQDHIFCAGYRHRVADACRGDTGSPFVGQKTDFSFAAVGIVSKKDGCAASGRFGIYTDVAKFIKWINRKTNNCSK